MQHLCGGICGFNIQCAPQKTIGMCEVVLILVMVVVTI